MVGYDFKNDWKSSLIFFIEDNFEALFTWGLVHAEYDHGQHECSCSVFLHKDVGTREKVWRRQFLEPEKRN